MKRVRLASVAAAFLTALLCSSAWASAPPSPGTVNYVEGQVTLNGQILDEKSIGSAKLAAGESLVTQDGRAEILLNPGICLRIDHHSSAQMNTPGLPDTVVTLQTGLAMAEVADLHPQNDVQITAAGASTRLIKVGLYDFDADHRLLRVFDGEAVVQVAGREVKVKSGHELNLQSTKPKAEKFDRKASADNFYRWASLRSSYLAEANVDAARRYSGSSGWSPNLWYGAGWYWDPWFGAYTFIPADGIFYDPFGWGFYSPWYAFGAPFGLVYGYGFGFGGHPRHFGPGYHPPHVAGTGRAPGMTHAYTTRGDGFGGFASRSSGFGGGMSRGFSRGGFHGGGMGGGGFHGGGGGHR